MTTTLGAEPRVVLGAPSPGGLRLPDAAPTASQLYAPRGVHLDEALLAVADTGNHRVLLWHGLPGRHGAACDVVLGQPDAASEGPAASGRGPAHGFHLPTGVTVVDGNLVVADAWHHRVVVYDGVPEGPDVAPALVIGQDGPGAVEPNRGRPEPTAASCYWPFGVALVGTTFWVADTGNRRVLGWTGGLPSDGRPADVVLGQRHATGRAENRDGPPGPDSFRWPHDLAGAGDGLVVADAGNHRVLGWSPVPVGDGPASFGLGQPHAGSAAELPYVAQGPGRLRFPYGVATDGVGLAVADTANNRVLVWFDPPRAGWGAPADAVLGQPDFDAHGENRWVAVADDTFCWPYGIAWHGRHLAVADSGNNRVVLWSVEAG